MSWNYGLQGEFHWIFYSFWFHQPQGILGIHNQLNRFLLRSSSTHRWKCTLCTRDLNPWRVMWALQPEMAQSINKPLLMPTLYPSIHISMLDSVEMYLLTHEWNGVLFQFLCSCVRYIRSYRKGDCMLFGLKFWAKSHLNFLLLTGRKLLLTL